MRDRPVSVRRIALESARAGTAGGLAMVPFGLVFRALGMRINEYGPRTLELVTGELSSPLASQVLSLVQHMLISWFAAVPLILVLRATHDRRRRALAGLAYGIGFYVLVNSLALPLAFGDPTPWELGGSAVLPSLVVHAIYGSVVGAFSWLRATRARSTSSA